MSSRYYYRIVLTNDFLGVSKEISAPTRNELDRRIKEQERIWNEKVNRELVRQNKEEMKKKSDFLTKGDKELILSYENIINNRYFLSYKKYYTSLKNNEIFGEFKTYLTEPNLEDIYIELGVPKKSFIEKIFKSLLNKRVDLENKASEVFSNRLEIYENELSKQKEDYENRKNKFNSEKKKFNDSIDLRQCNFENKDNGEIESYFLYVLNNSIYPSRFIKDFDIQYIQETNTIVVSYYLPNDTEVPCIIEHKYIASRNEIDEIKLNGKKFEKYYNDIIYMCCLKTISEIFGCDDLNYVDNVVYNGWIKYIDKSNGNNTESCVITVDVSKEKFMNINLENVDYKECIKGLKGIFAPNILDLTPVVPYLNINRNDKRFIESKEVNNISLDGFNLATMPWEDFEYFVRELFDKMFNANGGEVKVTRASRDGGVDAIAFDDDPIRGGKFVIQAKRYNNVVPVSAVRDLYGTMQHEGAVKGILVTTSSYGKDSFEFAKDKPLTLIDGQSLLGLLNKYGYDNLTIKTVKKTNSSLKSSD